MPRPPRVARHVLVAVVAVAALASATLTPAGADAPRTAPTLRSISISVVNQGETTFATIGGTHFASGATASLGRGIRCRVLSESATQLAIRLVVAPTAAYGPRTLTVTNPGGRSASLPKALHVDYAPVLAKWAVGQGAIKWPTTLARPTFATPPTLSFSGTGVSVASETVGNGDVLMVAFTVARDATAGWRSMTITQGLSTWSVTHGLKVRGAPTVSSVTPLGQGATEQGVKVRGSGFEVCAVKEPELSVSGTGVTVDAVSAALGNLMYATLTVASAAPLGPRAVTVTNCDSGGVSTTQGAFAVLGPPTVHSVAPIALGVTRIESFAGTNLTPATTLSASGSGITIDHVQYVSPSRLRATIAVTAGAALGPHDVTATDTGGAQTTAKNVLVVDPDPTATSLSQGGIGANTSVTLTVHGTDFERGAVVMLDDTSAQGPYLTVAAPKVVSSTELTVTIGALDDTPLGSVPFRVVNPDGGTTAPLALRTNPGPRLDVTSSTTRSGSLEVTYQPASGAPPSEPYQLRICENIGLSAHCATHAAIPSPATLHGLAPGVAYWAQLVAPTSGTFAQAASLVVGPVRATVQLDSPVVVGVWSSTTTAGAVRVTFRRPRNATAATLYGARACRDAAMTLGCVNAAHVTSGAQVTGLAPGRSYHVTVTALATPGDLAATSRPSRAIRATVALGVPTISSARLHRGVLTVRFTRATGAPAVQRYTLTACANASLTASCVVRTGYRSGVGVTVHGTVYFVRVTAVASPGYLAAASRTVRASG